MEIPMHTLRKILVGMVAVLSIGLLMAPAAEASPIVSGAIWSGNPATRLTADERVDLAEASPTVAASTVLEPTNAVGLFEPEEEEEGWFLCLLCVIGAVGLTFCCISELIAYCQIPTSPGCAMLLAACYSECARFLNL